MGVGFEVTILPLNLIENLTNMMAGNESEVEGLRQPFYEFEEQNAN